jgi:hypothetical protein
MATLQQILGAKNLIGRIQSVKPGLAADLLPAQLLAPGKAVEGNYGTYRKVVGERRVARVAQYGSPSQVREMKGISEIPVTLMHTIESINFKPALLQNLLNEENEDKQKNAAEEVARETASFHDLFENLRVAAVTCLMAFGKLWFDANGRLLLPTVAKDGTLTDPTGTMYSVDMGIPGGNRNQLNVYGSNIIAASWATTSTDIIGQLNGLKVAARKQTGYPLAHAFYGDKIFNYLAANTIIQQYMKFNPGYQEAFKRAEIPAGFLGFDWHPMREAFYATDTVPATGGTLDNSTPLSIWPDNLVTFTPEISPEWYELIQGTYPVSTKIDEEADSAQQLVDSIITATGMFAYAFRTNDPMGIKEVAGDTFLPVIKVPAAVYQGTVAGF